MANKKIKTHSGAKKRFSFTKKGKIKRKKSGLRHLLTTGKKSNRKRHLRQGTQVASSDQKRIRLLMPYGSY